MSINRNRLANVGNPYQGKRKRVLCVCSAGLLRSPTAAWILSNAPFDFNTRAVGTTSEFALIPLETSHVAWADEIVVMEQYQADIVKEMQQLLDDSARGFDFSNNLDKPVHVLTVPDVYGYREPELVEAMTPKLKAIFLENTNGTE